MYRRGRSKLTFNLKVGMTDRMWLYLEDKCTVVKIYVCFSMDKMIYENLGTLIAPIGVKPDSN